MLKNESLTQEIIAALYTAQEAAVELSTSINTGNTEVASSISRDLNELLSMLQMVGYEQQRYDKTIKLGAAAESILASLGRIDNKVQTDPDYALHKIEYELFPMLQAMYSSFYFWGAVFPDKDKLKNYFDKERIQLFANEYIEDSVKKGQYKYELSIAVAGYNKLEYTKMCVESLLENIPKRLNYELILVNHGSTDGTKEYFESINPDKQLDIKINSCDLSQALNRIYEGEFVLGISNDVIITPKAIDNMLKAMREDESIGFLVPTTPNVANLQTIKFEYSDINSMKEFAKRNNKYDPYRHEIRTRLNNPVSMYRATTRLSSGGVGFDGLWFTTNDATTVSFPDDLMSLLMRRAGYKNVLAKDAFCHHFGSVTIKDDMKKKQIDNSAYAKGREDFKAAFGIDPWGTGYCYDPQLVKVVECRFDGHVEVLGVNCGMGSNSLKVKEMYKEERHNLDVYLKNVTSDEAYIEDLAGVSDEAAVIREIEDIPPDVQYQHIVLEDPIRNGRHEVREIKGLMSRLVEGGMLYVRVGQEEGIRRRIKQLYTSVDISGEWIRVKNEGKRVTKRKK